MGTLIFMLVLAGPLAVVLYGVVAHLAGPRRMTPAERARIVGEIRWRRANGLPRPPSPGRSLLLPLAVAAVVGGLLILAFFTIGPSPLWFLFLPLVAAAAFLPFAVFLGSDRRPSPYARGFVRGQPIDPWEDPNPGRDMHLVRRCVFSIDTGPLAPPPRRHGGAPPTRKDRARR